MNRLALLYYFIVLKVKLVFLIHQKRRRSVSEDNKQKLYIMTYQEVS